MGACYSVYLKARFLNEKCAIANLKAKIERAPQEHINYGLDEYEKRGIGTETLDDLIRIFLADRPYNCYEKHDEGDFTIYTNAFDASYGWERVMMEMFDEMAPFLADGSEFDIYPDSGLDRAVVKDGKAEWVS